MLNKQIVDLFTSSIIFKRAYECSVCRKWLLNKYVQTNLNVPKDLKLTFKDFYVIRGGV